MAEGAPLLRVYRGNLIEGSNPSLSAIQTKRPQSSDWGLFVCMVEMQGLSTILAGFDKLRPSNLDKEQSDEAPQGAFEPQARMINPYVSVKARSPD